MCDAPPYPGAVCQFHRGRAVTANGEKRIARSGSGLHLEHDLKPLTDTRLTSAGRDAVWWALALLRRGGCSAYMTLDSTYLRARLAGRAASATQLPVQRRPPSGSARACWGPMAPSLLLPAQSNLGNIMASDGEASATPMPATPPMPPMPPAASAQELSTAATNRCNHVVVSPPPSSDP